MTLGGGHGNPFQYSCLENPMDGGAWPAIVHGTNGIQSKKKIKVYYKYWDKLFMSILRS